MPIDTASLPLFLSAVAALLLVPGPDFFLISAQAASRGLRFGVACALGIALAGVLQTALVALGLGRLMEAWPLVATGIRLAGAAYLALLGIGLLRSWWRQRHQAAAPQAVRPGTRSPASLFAAGLASNLLNPKALLFFSVFIPQFVQPALGQPPLQIAVFGLLLTTLALLYNLGVALVFARLKHLVAGRGPIARHGDGLIGLLFLALAGRLAASRTA